MPTEEEHELYLGLSEYLSRPKLYALPQSQRKLMTLIVRRLLASSTFAISGTLGGLAEKLQNIIDNNHSEVNVEEQELQENLENFDELKDEWVDDEEEDSKDTPEKEFYTLEELKEIKEEKELLTKFYELAKKIDKNAKGEKLLTALEKGFLENTKNGGNKKALIFTESTRTQQYLQRVLEKTKYKGKIVLFNGSNNDEKSKEIYKNWCEKYKGTDKISGSKTADKRAALVEYFRDEAEIMTFCVLPHSRRSGIGRLLLEQMVEWAKSQHIRQIFLEVSEDNMPARQLYEKAGFVFLSKRPRYYHTTNGLKDALCMVKKIV